MAIMLRNNRVSIPDCSGKVHHARSEVSWILYPSTPSMLTFAPTAPQNPVLEPSGTITLKVLDEIPASVNTAFELEVEIKLNCLLADEATVEDFVEAMTSRGLIARMK